jgi:hypothetical protein
MVPEWARIQGRMLEVSVLVGLRKNAPRKRIEPNMNAGIPIR